MSVASVVSLTQGHYQAPGICRVLEATLGLVYSVRASSSLGLSSVPSLGQSTLSHPFTSPVFVSQCSVTRQPPEHSLALAVDLNQRGFCSGPFGQG